MGRLLYVGVKAVVLVDGKCLLLKREKPTIVYWDLPGGRMGSAESPEKTLERELNEELPGLHEYSVKGLIGAYPLGQNVDDGNELLFLTYLVLAKPFDVNVSQEHTEAVWITKGELSGFESKTGISMAPHFEVVKSALSYES